MRPVDKGPDLGRFKPYNDAQQSLIERLGQFCSYCERWIASGIHVEHKMPKAHYSALQYQWQNFLLACGNCNSSKGSGQFELSDYLWPDSDNTLRAFQYMSEGRVIPATGFGDGLDQKIAATWALLGLNRHPDVSVNGVEPPTSKDQRWLHRKIEWQKATRYKMRLQHNDSPILRESIIDMAIAKGMFSVWFTVFYDDIDMKRGLIAGFENTALSCFDDNLNLMARSGGQV